MDLLTALGHYSRVYMAGATQLATLRLARQWMHHMDDPRRASRVELEPHAQQSAQWASAGFLPDEAAPLIAAGMTVELAVAADPRTDAERIEYLADRMRMLATPATTDHHH